MEYELSGSPGFELGNSAIPKTLSGLAHLVSRASGSSDCRGGKAPPHTGPAQLLQRGEAAVPGEMFHDFF